MLILLFMLIIGVCIYLVRQGIICQH